MPQTPRNDNTDLGKPRPGSKTWLAGQRAVPHTNQMGKSPPEFLFRVPRIKSVGDSPDKATRSEANCSDSSQCLPWR